MSRSAGLWVGSSFQHQRRHGGDQRGLCKRFVPCRPIYRATSPPPARNRQESDFEAPASRSTPRDHRHRCPYHCRSRAWLDLPCPRRHVRCTDTLCGKKQHLRFPAVRAQRPPVAEDYRLSGAPILVIDLRAVFNTILLNCPPLKPFSDFRFPEAVNVTVCVNHTRADIREFRFRFRACF